MRRRSSLVVAALVLAAPVPALAAPRVAVAAPRAFVRAPAGAPQPQVLATDLLSPLAVSADPDGTVWYSQNYAGTLERRDPDGTSTTLARARGDLELAAVTELDGTVWYSVTGAGHTVGELHQLDPDGTDTVIADLYAHERDTNPDGQTRYGFRDLPKACADQLPAGGRASYLGKAETHPVNAVRAHGAIYVADAAANAVTVVAGDPATVTNVATLPPVRTTMTADYAADNDLPACTVGRDYWAEGVPTDVAVGPYGSLYVTSLPGGPGQTDGHPAGTLLRIVILTGQITVVASGLDNPTGVAVSDTGDVYVAELQANRISKVAVGTSTPVPYAEGTFPGDLEWTPDGLLATLDVLSGTSGEAGDPPRGELVSFN